MAKKKETQAPRRKILLPKVDVIFKLLFGDERNKDILIDFLQSILKFDMDEYEKITITDPHLKRETVKDKLGIVDVKLTSKSGKIIHIEIQVLEMAEMPERATYYNSKMLSAQLKSGTEFDTLKKTISIVITDFNIVKDSRKYHYTFELIDKETGVKFTDLVEIHTLELKKIPVESDNTAQYDWMKFLKSESEEEFDMIANKRPAIKQAVVELKRLSQTERAQMLYEDREKAIHDEVTRIKSARKKGIEEAKIEMAIKAINEGLSLDLILKLTGLDVDTIKNLQK